MPRGESYTDILVRVFQSQPGARIDGLGLAKLAGAYAWRTRVSEARLRLRAAGQGDIKNEQRRRADGTVASLYWFEPYQPVGQLELWT